MPIPLFKSIASWFLKKRIHQIDLFVKYPHEVQQELLHQLLNTAAGTEVGKRHAFDSIRKYRDFSERLPLVTYEDLAGDIERCRQGAQNIFWPTPIKWFAKSSGTTNAQSKFIPVSTEALENCHFKAGKDMLSLYFNNNENAQLLTGKCLRLGGSSELYQNNDSYFGDLSAIIIDNLPFWAELS
ncbi:MAG: GH3 auxin-responsive promoter family protein, partial [Flavobacteriaceae bacterium]